MAPVQPSLPHTVSPAEFPGSVPLASAIPPVNQPPIPHALPQPSPNVGGELPSFPVFPAGLIPGMVRKKQIGGGVPYASINPLDIPILIRPSDVPESVILERVSKFFKAIGEVNPSEGPMSGSDQRDSPVRKGGACISPPSTLQTGAEKETEAGSLGSGRLGLGAPTIPSEANQYDDVYSSYRKQISANYHMSLAVKAGSK
ncbi:uncharacterized protein LOC130801380 [Amaranthus tricolor]|uniref:uncharacterized protein LOC130801380 n=1 Tax=Amaranthus tricolor TaxID=29722 RepID=UPI0025859BB3|nr:uncharacterized protein LOC130801380 [Amaranthus tricolor]